MADLEKAFRYVMGDEVDPKHPGAITKDNNDALVRYGFNAKYHPDLVALGFFDAAKMDDATALTTAHAYFLKEYAEPVHAGDISSDVIAAKVCDLSFNLDPKDAGHIVQQAINHVGSGLKAPVRIVEDGHVGPITIKAINALPPGPLVLAICEAQESQYRRNAETSPRVAKCLAGLVARAKRIPRFAQAANVT